MSSETTERTTGMFWRYPKIFWDDKEIASASPLELKKRVDDWRLSDSPADKLRLRDFVRRMIERGSLSDAVFLLKPEEAREFFENEVAYFLDRRLDRLWLEFSGLPECYRLKRMRDGSRRNMDKTDEALLRRCAGISKEAVAAGNHPFGALLADSEGAILVESGNVEVTERDCTGHAETTVMRLASKKYSKEFLWSCTLYTTAEPCCMCVGAVYWGNVGRIVFGIAEKQLLELTGSHEENPTFDLPSREIVARGQKKIEIVGPVADEALQEEIVSVHRGYWG